MTCEPTEKEIDDMEEDFKAKSINVANQYKHGISTWERMASNMSDEELKAATVATVDAYIWRKKGSDFDDLVKARNWLNFCISTLEERNIF